MSAAQPALPVPTLPDAAGEALLRRLRASLATWRRGDPLLFGFGLLHLLLLLPTGFALVVDDRLFNGIPIWEKVMKFEAAIAIYALTLALYAHALPPGMAERRPLRWYRRGIVATLGLETVVIAGAAALGTASHFNPTPIGQAVYGVMGVCAVFFTAATAVYAVAIARNPLTGLPPVLKEALVAGLALTLPLTLVTAGTMGGMGSHHVGAAVSDAGGLPLLGWSRTVGDLRVAHFFGTHAMHFLPLFGFVSLRVWGPERRAPLRLFSLLFLALTAFTFVQALAGRPFLPVLG
jgi:hypothetical protein